MNEIVKRLAMNKSKIKFDEITLKESMDRGSSQNIGKRCTVTRFNSKLDDMSDDEGKITGYNEEDDTYSVQFSDGTEDDYVGSYRVSLTEASDESEADEEYVGLNIDDEDEDIEEESTESEEEIEDEDTEESPADDSQAPSSLSALRKSHAVDDEPMSDEEDTEESPEEPKKNTKEKEKYDNPLDNQYAVNFTLGNEVCLKFEGESNEVREGVVDGYDTEGFYRVIWSDGTTTNGLTDIALDELVTPVKECVCGSTDFLNEGKYTVCDRCGRRIRENAELLSVDKNKSKSGNKIHSEVHPVSTSTKPSIAEAIKKLLKGSVSINEDIDDEEDEVESDTSVFDILKKKLDNEFWTRQSEMIEDIEELGFTVEEANGEYIVVSSDEDDENVYQIFLGGTSRTMTLDFRRARML